MKAKKGFSGVFFLVVLLVISVAFIIASIWIVSSVNQKRTEVDDLVDQVALIVDLELDLMECLDLSDEENEQGFQASIAEIVNTDFRLDEFPELATLSAKTLNLKNYFQTSGVLMKFKPFQDELEALYFYASNVKQQKSEKLAAFSAELNEYWNYTHLLIMLACGLSLVLIVALIFVSRTRKRLSSLRIRNNMFLSSVTDCIIVCNNEGEIIEFNQPAAEVFGYSQQEIIGKPIEVIYASETDWKNVDESMNYLGFFKGEVVNKRKNGDHFVSFLSSNIVYDEQGSPIGTMGISRDITKQKRNEEQFQHIVDNATDIIYTTNIQGDITYVNTSANSVLGYSSKDFIGMSFEGFVHPDFLEEVKEHYNKQFRERSPETYLEFKVVKANGEEIWIGQNVRTTFSPIDPNQITGFFGILRNLNEIKKVEIELLKSEAKYRELFDNSKDLIQSVDANGGILYVNDAWKRTLGYSDTEMADLNLFDIIHKDSRDYCEELLSEILMIGAHDDQREHFFRLITAEGKSVVLKGTLSVKYENGQVRSLQTFLRDVTEQHEVEQALKRSEENFRLISNSINDVFFLYDCIAKKYEYISPNCEDVLGAKPSFFYEGNNYAEVYVHPDDIEAMKEMNRSVMLGVPSQMEYRRVLDGQLKWVDEKWFPIKDKQGNTISVSGICRDVTDVKEAYNTIYEQNKEISQSILYAKNIQESTLPTKEEVNAIVSDAFVFYRAKDVLSGDLYIVDNLQVNDEDCPVIIVGDCTGHGVPGSLLSLLCSGLLTESLTNSSITSPAEALGFVRTKLIRLFRSNPSKYILDGMDAAFCVLNMKENELHFAGANLSCFIIRNGEVSEYRGDKQPVGYSAKMTDFVNFTIDIEKGDAIYLTTDGYVDQFGGPKNKKFLKRRFTELLLEIQDLPMADQRKKVEERFQEWKGNTEQTDDIAMIGVKI